MLLAMNWGAALLMALGLGIVYWHATRDTGQHSCPSFVGKAAVLDWAAR